MASTTLASIAAATAVGYVLVRVDKGVSSNLSPTAPSRNRFVTTLTKRGLGKTNKRLQADGESAASAGAADTAALASLNAQRQHIYGFDTNSLNKDEFGVQYTAADS